MLLSSVEMFEASSPSGKDTDQTVVGAVCFGYSLFASMLILTNIQIFLDVGICWRFKGSIICFCLY